MLVVGLGEAAAVLVGRVAELAVLDAAFERVLAGRPSAVLIGGEAGVGKSRLVSEFAARARAAGAARVLYGYCLELSADGLPFAPFTAQPALRLATALRERPRLRCGPYRTGHRRRGTGPQRRIPAGPAACAGPGYGRRRAPPAGAPADLCRGVPAGGAGLQGADAAAAAPDIIAYQGWIRLLRRQALGCRVAAGSYSGRETAAGAARFCQPGLPTAAACGRDRGATAGRRGPHQP